MHLFLFSRNTRKFYLNKILFALQKLNKVAQKAPNGRLFHTVLFVSAVNHPLHTPIPHL